MMKEDGKTVNEEGIKNYENVIIKELLALGVGGAAA